MIELVILGTRCIAMNCGTCGVVFAMPAIAFENAFKEGGFMHCPNGHRRGWSASESQRAANDRAHEAIRLERDRLAQRIMQRDDEIRTVAKERDDARAQATRVKTRANNGVCQDCNRTFSNLLRHRATKHAIKCEVVPLRKASP